MAIRVSAAAAAEMFKRSKQLFFYCKSGGCNGLEYVLEPTLTKPEATDTMHLTTGVRLHVCDQSMFYLLGTEIDWKEDTMGSRFVFANPNAKSKCGCGSTFST